MNRPYLREKRENEKRLIREIKAKETILTALPPRCTFEHSWRCNYRCKKCTYSSLSRGEGFSAAGFPEWEWTDIEGLAEELFPTMKYVESTLLGEPFLSPQFPALTDLFRKYGVYYRPTTNGSLLSQDACEHINGVVDWLKCSFDAHTGDLYKKVYLNSNFDRVVSNLKQFSRNRVYMDPYPWFRVGLVLMRSNLNYLKEYSDFVFQELGVDDMEVMALNYANEQMKDEFYWDIPEVVNRAFNELIEHCIRNKYRLRLPFTRMPKIDGSWPDGISSVHRSGELNQSQPRVEQELCHKYSDDVLAGDIFGNREQVEHGYVWSNDMRINHITADDGTQIGICEYFTRPFFKPPTVEMDGRKWIKYESCGSCSTFVFGNLKEHNFRSLYNNSMNQRVRAFFYDKPRLAREMWMYPCRHCLCVEPIYRYESNGKPNVGVRIFEEADLYGKLGAWEKMLKSTQDKLVVLWGAGSGGVRVYDRLPFNVGYCVDGNSDLWGKEFKGVPVRKPESLLQESKDNLAVIVASVHYAEIANQLESMGLIEGTHFWNGLQKLE
jgi:MoaA/NifB/PqqE/SkfB family radical SAM enzyme